MGFISFIKSTVCNTTIGSSVINWVRIRNLDEKYYDLFIRKKYRKDKLNPTEYMLQSLAFFENNKDVIERNISLLEDDLSKDVYKKAIKYRCSHDATDEPSYTKEKYFCDILPLSEKEVFIDGGSFVGDTVRKFHKKTNGKYKKIVCFEPDTYNYKMLCKLKYNDVIKYNLGLWEYSTELNFFDNMSVGSKIVENGTKQDRLISIRVNSLDNIEECNDATIIKLDVEGSEQKAIKGATKIIKNNHPKLIICLYHSNEDMLDIIPLVHALNPEYKLYVRSHSHQAAETVLYAI